MANAMDKTKAAKMKAVRAAMKQLFNEPSYDGHSIISIEDK